MTDPLDPDQTLRLECLKLAVAAASAFPPKDDLPMTIAKVSDFFCAYVKMGRRRPDSPKDLRAQVSGE